MDTHIHEKQLDALQIPEDKHVVMHMVHTNHLDLIWYWQMRDTIEMCLQTIRWNVELVEKHPDARYSHSQVYILKLIEEIDPPLFERFKKMVQLGRIEINGGDITECDHNIPDGESLTRQFLYGQNYIEKHFGKRAEVLISADCFGHCRSFPQILKKAGIHAFLFKRPLEQKVHLPETPFYWKGIDGTRILSVRFINKGRGLPSLGLGYTGDKPQNSTCLQEKINKNLEAGVHNLFGSHCLSDAGGVTPYVPPRAGTGYELKYSTANDFAKAILEEKEAVYPELDGPLNYVMQGCYTTHIEEKKNCRQAERWLRETELMWSILSMQGYKYPSEEMESIWWRFCLLQFHDALPGSSSAESHRDDESHYHEIFFRLRMLRRKAQLMMDKYCRKTDSLRSFLVMNTVPYIWDGIAEADVDMRMNREDSGEEDVSELIPCKGILKDDKGNLVPYQIVNTRVYQRYMRGTMLFCADRLEPFGLKEYNLCDLSAAHTKLKVWNRGIENETIRITIGDNGVIHSIYTKKDNREWLKAVPEPIRVELWDDSDGNCWTLGNMQGYVKAILSEKAEVTEDGPVRASIRTTHKWGNSVFNTYISLYESCEWVEIRCEMDWNEKEKLVRLCIEPELSGKKSAFFGIPFGYEKSTGKELEIPAAGWVNLNGEDGGITLVNRDRPGHTFVEDVIRVSLVRCSTRPYDPCSDSGRIATVFRLLPHSGTLQEEDIPKKAFLHLQPPVTWQCEEFTSTDHLFEAPLKLDGRGVVFSAFKPAERGKGYVARLYESLGEQSKVRLYLGTQLVKHHVFEANLLEDRTENKELLKNQGMIELEFEPFEIKTILFTGD